MNSFKFIIEVINYNHLIISNQLFLVEKLIDFTFKIILKYQINHVFGVEFKQGASNG